MKRKTLHPCCLIAILALAAFGAETSNERKNPNRRATDHARVTRREAKPSEKSLSRAPTTSCSFTPTGHLASVLSADDSQAGDKSSRFVDPISGDAKARTVEQWEALYTKAYRRVTDAWLETIKDPDKWEAYWKRTEADKVLYLQRCLLVAWQSQPGFGHVFSRQTSKSHVSRTGAHGGDLLALSMRPFVQHLKNWLDREGNALLEKWLAKKEPQERT